MAVSGLRLRLIGADARRQHAGFTRMPTKADGRLTTSYVAASPIEPSEPSPRSSMPGRLYGDDDGSVVFQDETRARLRALGRHIEPHKPFACVFDWHDHDARVYSTTSGFWHYSCDGLPHGIGLGEVRAMLAYGSERRISNLEAARWRERLDFEAGLRFPGPLAVELPEPHPAAAGKAAGGMSLFVGLRDPRFFPLGEPFVFAYDFAQAYCGLTGDQVRSAKEWLERHEVIYRVAKHGRAILWKLAAQDETVAKRRAHAVAAREWEPTA